VGYYEILISREWAFLSLKTPMSLPKVGTGEESKEDKMFYKALFVVIVVVFTLILIKSNILITPVKQLKHKEMNKEKYI